MTALGAHRSTAIGIDVGGTTVKGLLVDAEGAVVLEHRAPTPSPDPTGEGVVDVITRLVDHLGGTESLQTGVVVPGVVDEGRGTAVLSTNIGWKDVPLHAMLERRLGRGISFGHDVRAGALAEARWGAAADRSDTVVFVPIGTGIAAALLSDSRPLVSGGWAGEIGQLVIGHGPFAGLRVEEVASAEGTARRAHLPSARDVADRVLEGDPAAVVVWNDTITVLADALVTLTAVVGPEMIVIGGGLALSGHVLLDPLERAFSDRLGPALRRPVLVQAQLGDRAAALGAALLAFRAAGATV